MTAQAASLLLADIAWFIKGWLAARGSEGDMGIGDEHTDALAWAIQKAREDMEREVTR